MRKIDERKGETGTNKQGETLEIINVYKNKKNRYVYDIKVTDKKGKEGINYGKEYKAFKNGTIKFPKYKYDENSNITHKICTKCHEPLELNETNLRIIKKITKEPPFNSICKICEIEYSQNYDKTPAGRASRLNRTANRRSKTQVTHLLKYNPDMMKDYEDFFGINKDAYTGLEMSRRSEDHLYSIDNYGLDIICNIVPMERDDNENIKRNLNYYEYINTMDVSEENKNKIKSTIDEWILFSWRKYGRDVINAMRIWGYDGEYDENNPILTVPDECRNIVDELVEERKNIIKKQESKLKEHTNIKNTNHLDSKPIYCLNYKKSYPSHSRCARELGIDASNIRSYLEGKRVIHDNRTNEILHFISLESIEDKVSDEKVNKLLKEYNKKYKDKDKRVVCVETKTIFKGPIDTNINNVSCCCNHRKRNGYEVKSAGGYHWLYYPEYVSIFGDKGLKYRDGIYVEYKEIYGEVEIDDEKRILQEKYTEKINRSDNSSQLTYCVNTGNIYNSKKQAKNENSEYTKNTGERLYFIRLNNRDEEPTLKKRQDMLRIFFKVNKDNRVVCLDTGIIYANPIQISKVKGISKSQIIDCCNHRLC